MNEDNIFLTEEGLKEKEKYLSDLNLELQAALESRRKAVAMGDLSENAEYQAAVRLIEKLNVQINELHKIINKATVLSSNRKYDKISLGAKFILEKLEKKETISYQLVSSVESNIFIGKLSIDSNFGKILIGKKVNEIISFNNFSYKVIKIL